MLRDHAVLSFHVKGGKLDEDCFLVIDDSHLEVVRYEYSNGKLEKRHTLEMCAVGQNSIFPCYDDFRYSYLRWSLQISYFKRYHEENREELPGE